METYTLIKSYRIHRRSSQPQKFNNVVQESKKQKGAMLDGILRFKSDGKITEAALQQDGYG